MGSMLEFLVALAAPQDGQQQDELLVPSNVEHQRLSLGQINNMYRNGRPSSDLHLTGLFVHQHDNTEGAEAMVFEATTDEEKDWVATSIVNKGLPGMYNSECGVIIDPSAVEVQCSYYADMTSWSTGCDAAFLATSGWHDPKAVSKVRETPFPPDQLMDMMKMSQELQSNKTALTNYRTARNDGTGEPDGAEFWLGQYNEVLIDKALYVSNLPFSVAAVFHVEGGDDAESCSCIQQARAAMIARYGSDAEHVLLLKHTPGANTAFVNSECTAGQKSEEEG